jgi:EAL domain-containing protein (putative c-di-GMP-specific phosphodiesterase class I)
VANHSVLGATPKPTVSLDGMPVLEFQPAVDLATGRLIGFEALLRWDHPTRGTIPPAVLVPWAEANGQIDALNAWVFDEACRQASGWPSGVQLAVNCSLVQLRHGEASVALARAMTRRGLNPDRVTVEIGESAVADDRANQDLRNLTRLGVHLAVDDVGTSWATLENLRRFSIETAKIDRNFVSSLERPDGMNRAIVEAIVNISHSLAMSTVAEGVEAAGQVTTLQEIGADVAQGFFFSPPVTGGEAVNMANAEPAMAFSLTTGDQKTPTPSPLPNL